MKHLTDADIQTYLDGNLGDGVRTVEDHLHTCEMCRGHVEEYRALYAQLADDSALPVYRGLSDAVIVRAIPAGSWKERSGFVDAILAAGGAVIAVVTFLLLSDLSPLTAGLTDLGHGIRQLLSVGAHLATGGSEAGFRPSVLLAAAAVILIAYFLNGLTFCWVMTRRIRDRSRRA